MIFLQNYVLQLITQDVKRCLSHPIRDLRFSNHIISCIQNIPRYYLKRYASSRVYHVLTHADRLLTLTLLREMSLFVNDPFREEMNELTRYNTRLPTVVSNSQNFYYMHCVLKYDFS